MSRPSNKKKENVSKSDSKISELSPKTSELVPNLSPEEREFLLKSGGLVPVPKTPEKTDNGSTEKIKKLENEIASLKASIEKSEKNNKALQTRLDKKDETLKTAKDQLTAANKKHREELSSVRTKHKEELTATKAELKDQLTAVKAELKEEKNRTAELEKELRKAVEKSEITTDDSQSDATDGLRDEIEDLTEKLNAYRERAKNLEKKLDEILKENETLRNRPVESPEPVAKATGTVVRKKEDTFRSNLFRDGKYRVTVSRDGRRMRFRPDVNGGCVCDGEEIVIPDMSKYVPFSGKKEYSAIYSDGEIVIELRLSAERSSASSMGRRFRVRRVFNPFLRIPTIAIL